MSYEIIFFFFLVHFGLPYKFFSLKNRKLFLETENKGKKQLPNIPYYFWSLNFWVFYLTKENKLSYRSNWVGLLMGHPKRAASEQGCSQEFVYWEAGSKVEIDNDEYHHCMDSLYF